MTAICIWENRESEDMPSLWVVADSYVTNRPSVLLSNCIKSMPIHLSVRRDHFSLEIQGQDIGYAFSGSALFGLNFHYLLNMILGNIIFRESQVSLGEVASYARDLFKCEYMRFGRNESFEFSLFGKCNINNRNEIYHLRWHFDISGELVCESDELSGEVLYEKKFAYLGDNRIEMNGLFTRGFQEIDVHGRSSHRSPIRVLEHVVNERIFSTIGGGVGLAIIQSNKFKAYNLCRPMIPGRPEARILMYGVDVTDIPTQFPGGGFFSMPALC